MKYTRHRNKHVQFKLFRKKEKEQNILSHDIFEDERTVVEIMKYNLLLMRLRIKNEYSSKFICTIA